MSDHLKMIWIATQTVIAFVVNLFLSGDEPEEVAEHDDMDCDCLSVQRHPAITTASTITGGRTSPVPTPSIFVDFDSCHDLVKDLLATVGYGRKSHFPNPSGATHI